MKPQAEVSAAETVCQLAGLLQLQVYLLGKDLDLDPLVHRAEAVVVQEVRR